MTPISQSSQQGFTLIELLIVLTIIGLIAIIFTYNVRGWVQQSRLNEAASQVVADLRQARSRAQLTSQNSVVVLCAVTTGTCNTTSAVPSPSYSASWGATTAGAGSISRNFSYGILIAPISSGAGGDYPNSMTYTAPYAETTAVGTIWRLSIPGGPQTFIKVTGVTGKVSISATSN